MQNVTSVYFGSQHDLHSLIQTHLFVICPNNSGSTYLKQVLATSRNTWNLAKEGQHMLGFSGPSSRKFGEGKLWATDRWRHEFTNPTAFNWNVIRKAWYFQAYSSQPSATVFVEKSPPLLLNTAQLVQHFSNAKFIIMVRNPYATVEGIRRRLIKIRRKPSPQTASTVLQQAALHVMNCFQFQQKNIEAYADRSVFFTYEQLCDQPQVVEAKIKMLVPQLTDLTLKQQLQVKDYNEILRNMNLQQVERFSRLDIQQINQVFDLYPECLTYFGYSRLND